MSLWDKSGKIPTTLGVANSDVIITDSGFEYKNTYTDLHGNTRNKEYILVAIGGLSGEVPQGGGANTSNTSNT